MSIYNCFLKYMKYDKIVRDYIVVYIQEHFFELKVKSDDKRICLTRGVSKLTLNNQIISATKVLFEFNDESDYEVLYYIDCVNGQIVFSDESNKVIFESPNALFDYLHSRFA